MRKYWLTLGTILAGTWGVSSALQRADGQGLQGPTIVSESGTVITAPESVAAPVPTGAGAFFYGGPTSNAVVAEFGGEGMSEEMQGLMQADGELEGQVQAAVAEYSGADPDSGDRDVKRKVLNDLLSQQFDARQQRRELEIKQIEERVKKLREALEKRSSAKETIIERRMNDLLTDAEGLGWGDAVPGTPGFGLPRSPSPYGPSMGGGRREGGGSPYGPSAPGREGSPYGGGGGPTRPVGSPYGPMQLNERRER